MPGFKSLSPVCILLGLLTATDPVAAADNDAPVSRYPTSEEALYVLGCVERNGQNAEGLQKCSCAINAIEAQLSYEDYSQAVLVFAMRQAGGERAALYRDTIPMREIADRFIRAQTRANRQCFGRENPSTR